jgi:hypothetical protein
MDKKKTLLNKKTRKYKNYIRNYNISMTLITVHSSLKASIKYTLFIYLNVN